MQACVRSINGLLQSLPPRPIDKETFDKLVSETLSSPEHKASAENRKTQWEYALKNEIFTLAASEGAALKDPHTTYYEDLRIRLDLVLAFTEHDACEQIFPLNVLYELLETQTIASCHHIFTWIEERADRLTEGLVPQKGKALILLRTLNDLLRRLSKMGSTTMFCGRILTFLSRVFPLGERSGVNLRGEYGPMWEGPGLKLTEGLHGAKNETEAVKSEEKMEVDEHKEEGEAKRPPQEQKDDFYQTFWSLQLPFSRPPLFAEPKTFPAFKEAVEKVLPVIKEATAKERALMGSKTGTGTGTSLKRKREPEEDESVGNDYFFAKYLTSPDLLELEIADTHFRRQFLFQLLVLLHHLLTFSKAAKAQWSNPRNRSLQMDFTLEETDAQWVQEIITKANEELRQTTPNGRTFAETVAVILEREKNWVKWKNALCQPFDLEAWSIEVEREDEGRAVKRKIGLEEATRDIRKKMREPPKEWEHKLGSGPLTEIWEMGYRDLSDLQHPFQPGDVQDFVKKVKQEDARIDMRKKQLARAAERVAQARAKAAAPTPTPKDITPPTASQETPRPPPVPMPAPTPLTAPLHPSLPAKPVSGPKAGPSQPQEASPAATPVSAPAPAPAPTPTPTPAVEPTPKTPPDEVVAQYEENKQRWSWLALRTTRDQYLQHFGKIGTGDVVQLAQEIEKERIEREQALREEANNASNAKDDRGTSAPAAAATETPSASEVNVAGVNAEAEGKAEESSHGSARDTAEGDVKMEA